MSLEIALPWAKKGGVEDLVFTILTKEYPLRIIDLMNFIRKRYGKGVTFQAVRKAVLQLTEKRILLEKDRKYFINRWWVLESKKFIDNLYEELTMEKLAKKNFDSIKGDVTVFTFNSLNEMMKFWQNLIDDWYGNFKKGDYGFNCYQAAHTWEGLLHPDVEKKIMHQLKKKGIKSRIVTLGNSPLDRQVAKFYSKIGVRVDIVSSTSTFDKSFYVGTYGDLVVQTQYPLEIVKMLDSFFKNNKSLSDLDLVELSNIVNKQIRFKLTVIKNLAMAKQMNKSIISQVE